MSIDLSQFIGTFLEESYEGLEVMETGLLNFDASDEETINSIFRAAHSIKGGAGTFGFNDITNFTHTVETLLDEMRGKKLEASISLVNLLLESVDCIKALLKATQDGPEADALMISSVKDRLQQALDIEVIASDLVSVTTEALETSSVDVELEQPGWNIHFIPNAEVLRGGHEPLFMFEALAEMGALKVKAVINTLPALCDFDPEDLNLSWEISLHSRCVEEEVREIFEWIEDECDLIITPLQQITTMVEEGWKISFVPEVEVLKTGNEPSLMFNVLSELGDITVTAVTQKLPSLMELCPDELYLSWDIRLESDCTKEQILEVFEWVEDACELEVTLFAAVVENIAGDSKPVELITSQTLSSNSEAQESANNASRVSAAVAESIDDPKSSSAPGKAKNTSEASSIRVDTDKVDALINRVGELVITQAMLGQVGADLADITSGPEIERLQTGLELLERNTRDLQEDVMRVRMLPISFVFNRFPRLVHDISGNLGKKVELIITGEQTEIDKTVMEKIGDPMIHLIRNSLDHGIEEPHERIAAGKTETGKVQLNAYHQGGYIVIDIIDDGRGLNTQRIFEKALEKGLINADQSLTDNEINELVFKAGFSTADVVTDLSGRGVGMDVVCRNVESLGGQVSVKSEPGRGSTFSVRLPLTLAILEGQLVRVYDDTYIIPLVSIVETILADNRALNSIAGESRLLHFRDEYIPLIDLKTLFKFPVKESNNEIERKLIAVVESGGKKVGLIVEELYGQQQVVIKSLEANFKRIEGLAGATILGDGSVALILDVAGLMQRSRTFEIEACAEKDKSSLKNNLGQRGTA